MNSSPRQAPDWTIETWLNTPEPLSLAGLQGRVIVAAAFQMLCPGCIERTIPQLRQAHSLFPREDVAVIGLHTVFEHHEAMRRPSLEAFLPRVSDRLSGGDRSAGAGRQRPPGDDAALWDAGHPDPPAHRPAGTTAAAEVRAYS